MAFSFHICSQPCNFGLAKRVFNLKLCHTLSVLSVSTSFMMLKIYSVRSSIHNFRTKMLEKMHIIIMLLVHNIAYENIFNVYTQHRNGI